MTAKQTRQQTVARQWKARQWTGWREVFSARSKPMAGCATMDTTMGSILYAARAEGL
jgi:hypothetical protein